MILDTYKANLVENTSELYLPSQTQSFPSTLDMSENYPASQLYRSLVKTQLSLQRINFLFLFTLIFNGFTFNGILI